MFTPSMEGLKLVSFPFSPTTLMPAPLPGRTPAPDAEFAETTLCETIGLAR